MKVVCQTNSGKLIHGDNIDVLKTFKENSIDNCISDFPYDLSFMGREWDTTGNFYEWCKLRADGLYRVIKHGGYVLVFGHHKTNHRMKSAFEDVGFNIVEEINWVYGTGFPKNQDMRKMFSKKDKIDLAKKWDGWKTSGLKPAKEPITVFQKPLQGTYCDNIEKWNCGAMNIDDCRIPISQEDRDTINKKASKNPTTNYSDSDDRIYGVYAEDKSMPANEIGRFPANIIFDTYMGDILDKQSGVLKSGMMKAGTKRKNTNYAQCPTGLSDTIENSTYGDSGGASRFFLSINADDYMPFLYCAKPTKKEKGEYNKHITVKPKELIKWLIKLVTPKDGITIDITAGSGTHGLSCEELNRDEGYDLKWFNVEMLNTEKEPYCDIAMKRIQDVANKVS